MHLMGLAIEHLQSRDVLITEEEEEAARIAILLHDVGHGPFSHALESTIVEGINHEYISSLLMADLNKTFKGRLNLAIAIFTNKYHKTFLHQLISGQLDLDRMDYLNRDSFFSGVTEGMVSSDRIIKLLNVRDHKLVVEEKGIYSIENFLISRRLMYWQVYLHKTVIAAEQLLAKILLRAKELAKTGVELFATPNFKHFLYNQFSQTDFEAENQNLKIFSALDDHDIFTSVKVWVNHPDFILSTLCKNLISRNLYKVEIKRKPIEKEELQYMKQQISAQFNVSLKDASYFIFSQSVSNNAYLLGKGSINILMNNGKIIDITEASDNANLQALSKTVKKYILCTVRTD